MDKTAASAPDPPATSENSLAEDLRLLADEGKAFVRAELTYQKARAAFAGEQTPRIAGLAVLALFFLFFALMALTMGVLLALVPTLSPLGATGVVVGALLLMAALCALAAAHRFGRMRAALDAEDNDTGAAERPDGAAAP